MAVEVNAVAVASMRRINRLRHRCVVRLPAVGNARTHLGHRQRAPINWQSVISGAPDQPLAQPQFFQRAKFGGHRVWPGLVKQRNIDIRRTAIGIQIAARKQRLNPGHAQAWCKVVKLLDVGVFSAA